MAEILEFPSLVPVPEGNDAVERALALEISQSYIVEAPAGSGKTGLLIQRLLKLLASAAVTDPAQILAVTFTRKATHEMRDRVLGQLAAAQAGTPVYEGFEVESRRLAEAVLEHDAALGWRLLEHPDRLNIKTIDALSIEIAGSLPVLSGAGGQTPVDRAAELYAQAARRTLNLLGGEDEALTRALETVLLHRDGNLADCEQLIAEMLQWRDQWTELIPHSPADLTDEYLERVTLPKLEKALDSAICRALTRLNRLMPPVLLQQLCDLASEMARADGYKGAPSPIAICRGRNQPPEEKADDLEYWAALAHLLVKPSAPRDWRKALHGHVLRVEIVKQHQAELKQIIADLEGRQDIFDALCALTTLPPLTYPPEQWHVAKALFRVLSRALTELQAVFSLRSECDFTEFSVLARRALGGAGASEDLAASAGMRLEHLLVDEMQDTSNSQYELIRLLTAGWDGREQTVFLVGDPKQSIYLFREARVERFIDTLRAGRLGPLALEPLYLTANFRSQAELVAGFNRTFLPIFPAAEGTAGAEMVVYRPATASRLGSAGKSIVWHAYALPYEADAKRRAELKRAQSRAHAGEIRAIVEGWRARPLPEGRTKPWKIAVLVAARSHLREVVQAFDAGEPIPYRAVKVVPLAERQEILDLLALTRAVLHPADRTAMLALLRTPWCGLTLRDVHLLAGADDRSLAKHTILELVAERGELLSEDGVARLQPFWTVLSAALAQRGRMPLAQIVERTWRAFAAPSFASEEELANAGRYFELLDELEGRPEAVTAGRLEAALKELYAAPSTAEDAVDLMTIHGSKGLEWDLVLIPALERPGQSSRGRLLSWLEVEGGNEDDAEVAHGIIAPVQPKGKEGYALNAWMRSIESAREAAERKRLFYVACTRAREELHLFAAPALSAKGEITRGPSTLLAAAWPAAERAFALAEPKPVTLDLAAAASLRVVPLGTTRTIKRVPLEALPVSGRTSAAPVTGLRAFERPEGAFEARAFGTAMHAFLELLTGRIAGGAAVSALTEEVEGWGPRISAVLRSSGLGPGAVAKAAANVQRGLVRTLGDGNGRWVLAAHAGGASEAGFTSADAASIRLDRTFVAGEEPGATGETHLWIVDFKTSAPGGGSVEAFRAQEREKYGPQLETYAGHLAVRGLPIRLALYYPMLGELIWWRHEDGV